MREKNKITNFNERNLIFFRYRKLFMFLLTFGWICMPFILIILNNYASVDFIITLAIVAVTYFYFFSKNRYTKNGHQYKTIMNNCAPEEGIREANKVINARFTTKPDKFKFYILKALCLYGAGRFDEAQDELKKIGSENVIKYLDCGDILYLQYSATFHIAKRELDDAVNDLEKMKEIAKKYENTKLDKKAKSWILLIEKRITFEKKLYDNCTSFYYSMFMNESASMYHKVNWAYILGLISIEYNELALAKNYFTFAASNGNTLYFAQKAKEQIVAIEMALNKN